MIRLKTDPARAPVHSSQDESLNVLPPFQSSLTAAVGTRTRLVACSCTRAIVVVVVFFAWGFGQSGRRHRRDRETRRAVRHTTFGEIRGLRAVDDRIDRLRLGVEQSEGLPVSGQAEIDVAGPVGIVRPEYAEAGARDET